MIADSFVIIKKSITNDTDSTELKKDQEDSWKRNLYTRNSCSADTILRTIKELTQDNISTI